MYAKILDSVTKHTIFLNKIITDRKVELEDVYRNDLISYDNLLKLVNLGLVYTVGSTAYVSKDLSRMVELLKTFFDEKNSVDVFLAGLQYCNAYKKLFDLYKEKDAVSILVFYQKLGVPYCHIKRLVEIGILKEANTWVIINPDFKRFMEILNGLCEDGNSGQPLPEC